MNGYCSTDTTRCDQHKEMCRQKDAELARMREIAGCFRPTDSTNLEEILDSLRLHGEKKSSVAYAVDAMKKRGEL